MTGFDLKLIIALAGLRNWFVPLTLAIDTDCDSHQNMVLNQNYYVYNKEYPNYYKPEQSCRWSAVSPSNTKIVLNCDDINLPATSNCNGDRLSISLTGNHNFEDAQNFCGTTSFSQISQNNRMTIGLFTSRNTTGGRFFCTLSVINSGSTGRAAPPTCDCGQRQIRRIVGGEETGKNEFPSVVALVHAVHRNLYCGATIISNRYALTAAHCMINRDASETGLLVGTHDRRIGDQTTSAVLYVLEGYLIHPKYNVYEIQNDISIVQTKDVIAFGMHVEPICLPFRHIQADFVGINAYILGWGTIDYGGPISNVLRQARVDVISNNECRNQLNRNITNLQICTYAPDRDTCQKDSGGPLLWYDSSSRRLHLIGIISYGLGCAIHYPGVNTRITSYLLWILSNTRDANYCYK